MTNTNEVPRSRPMTPEHKQKMAEGRARAKARRLAKQMLRPPVVHKEVAEFAGMTAGEGWNSRCAEACNIKTGCVITRGEGSGNCGHPEKGGLQAADLLKPKVVERYNAARKYLAHLKVDKR